MPGDRRAAAPDHATIARFVVRHERALGELFGEVLALCADAGLATVGVVAIDGTKVHANANRDRTMDYEQIARAIVEEAIETDAAETAVHGERRGDELPEIVATAHGRQGWLRAARQRLEQQRAQRPSRSARAAARLLEAKRRLEEELSAEREANASYEAYRGRGVMQDGRRFGGPPKPYTPPADAAGKINLTDPDSQLVHGMRGWRPGLQRPSRLQRAVPDPGRRGDDRLPGLRAPRPMVTAARAELAAAGVTRPRKWWSPTPATGIWSR